MRPLEGNYIILDRSGTVLRVGDVLVGDRAVDGAWECRVIEVTTEWSTAVQPGDMIAVCDSGTRESVLTFQVVGVYMNFQNEAFLKISGEQRDRIQ